MCPQKRKEISMGVIRDTVKLEDLGSKNARCTTKPSVTDELRSDSDINESTSSHEKDGA